MNSSSDVPGRSPAVHASYNQNLWIDHPLEGAAYLCDRTNRIRKPPGSQREI